MILERSSSSPLRGCSCVCFALLLCASLSTTSTASEAHEHSFFSSRTVSSIAEKQGADPKPEQQPSIPGQADEVLRKPKIWAEDTAQRLNVNLTLAIAIVWIILFGSAPIALHVMEHGWCLKSVTNTILIMSILMWTAFFSGLYAFTHIVLFESGHFDRVRSLTVVECTYFMSQVITTVGYGDIVPKGRHDQVFVALYAAFAVVVIAELMAQMMEVIKDRVAGYKTDSEEMSELRSGIKRPSLLPLCKSFACFAVFASIWVLFFHYFPEEDKGWMQAFFMAIITMSTIGLGAITPNTEEGMIFASFFMIIGAASLAKVVMDFSTLMVELTEYERWTPTSMEDHLHEITDGAQEMTEVHYIIYALREKGLASTEQLDSIRQTFQALHPGKDGMITARSIEDLVDRDIEAPENPDEPESERPPRSPDSSNPRSEHSLATLGTALKSDVSPISSPEPVHTKPGGGKRGGKHS